MPNGSPLYCLVNPYCRQIKKVHRRLERLKRRVGERVTILEPQSIEAAQACVQRILAECPTARIVSISGDGGAQVIFAAVFVAKQELLAKWRAKHTASEETPVVAPVVATIGAGGVNDHAVMVHHGSNLPRALHRFLNAKQTRPLDLIGITIVSPDGSKRTFQAHSHVCLGHVADVAEAINAKRPGIMGQVWLAVRSLIRGPKPFRVIMKMGHGEVVQTMISLSVHNISRFGGYLYAAPHAQIDSGELELLEVPAGRRNRLTAVRYLARALLRRPVIYRVLRFCFRQPLTQPGHRWEFTVLSQTAIEIDGNTRLTDGDLKNQLLLNEGTRVIIECLPGALDTWAAAA